MVGGTHNDTHVVGYLGRQGVVLIEAACPHGRPEIVGFKAQQEFEDTTVSLVVHSAKLLVAPCTERGPLIVYEDATVLHLRLAVCKCAFGYIERIVTGYRRIGHPVPGRYAYLAAQLIDAVDGATLVGTKDEQRGTIGAGHGGGGDDV